MNPKSITLYLLVVGIIFSNHQIFAQDTVIIASNQWICYDSIPDTLTSQVFDTVLQYQWQDSTSFGEWNDIDGAIDSIYYSSEGLTDTTFFRLIVENEIDTLVSNTIRIAVYKEFVIGSITGTVNESICVGDSGGILTANPSGGSEDFTIEWYKDDTITTQVGPTYVVGPLYEYSEFYYTVVDEGGCGDGESVEFPIDVYDTLATGEIYGGNSPICYGGDGGVLHSDASGGSEDYTIKWFKNGDYTDHDGSDYSVGTLNASTEYYYRVEDLEGCGVEDSESVTIHVFDNLVAGDISGGNTPICAGGDGGVLTSHASGGSEDYTIKWYKNNEDTGFEGTNYTVGILTETTNFSYEVIDEEDCGEVTSEDSPIVVSDSLIVEVEITTNTTSICKGDVAYFEATPTNGGLEPHYRWIINGGTVGDDYPNFESSTIENGDMVSCELTSDITCTNENTVESEKIEMNVQPLPEINDLWVKTVPEIGHPLVLIVCCPESESGYTYTWYKDDEKIPGETGQYYYNEGGIEEGTYYALVTNSYACSRASQVFQYPNDKDGLFENSHDLFLIYPNPSDGQFEIGINDNNIPLGVASVTINIFTITGQKIVAGTIEKSYAKFHLLDMESGIYIVELSYSGNQKQIKKLLIQ